MTNHLTRPVARVLDSLLAGLGLAKLRRRLALAEVRRAAYARARVELDAYSDRDLHQDLRVDRAQIPDLALEEADLAVAAFVRAHPEHRQAGRGDRAAGRFAYMAH